ncbi:MAG: enoyl-CoA hydratase/isomerase family protein [Actinobacteria bacterium]|jgi:enoyl-CoA hydratase/carnithine racemase|nr:enoyl-CoA hydratase/isomerase family protein [Actinomycetota bacterium]
MGSLTSETPTFETLRIEHEGRIGRITLNRPEKLNPLSTLCLEELALAAGWFDGQDAIRVVVVTGAGRAFTAGADLSAFTAGDSSIARSGADAGRLMAEAIEGMQAVTIAAIHGHCVGGGVVLAGACDFRVAAESTRFSIPEVDLGIPLAWGGIPRLVREIGPAATRDLVMTCRPFTTLEAHVRGFVTRMVDDDKLVAEVEDLAATLAAKSSLTLRATLIAVDAAAEALVSTRFAWSDADVLVNAMRDPESREVGAAYLRERGR